MGENEIDNALVLRGRLQDMTFFTKRNFAFTVVAVLVLNIAGRVGSGAWFYVAFFSAWLYLAHLAVWSIPRYVWIEHKLRKAMDAIEDSWDFDYPSLEKLILARSVYGTDGTLSAWECENAHLPGDCPLCGAT